MEFKPPSPIQKKETIDNKAIELVENSILESGKKLELMLLLLDKKQGVQLGNYQIAESEEEKKKVTEEFTQELSEIEKLLNELKLQYKIVKELGDDNGIVGFSVLTSKDKGILSKFVQANNEDDDKAFGLILGYPATAVETYGTDQAFNIHEELAQDDLERLKSEGILPFLLFMPSKEHWDEELEWARENQQLVKEKAPKLYQELIQTKE
jgi:hypothetical protein